MACVETGEDVVVADSGRVLWSWNATIDTHQVDMDSKPTLNDLKKRKVYSILSMIIPLDSFLYSSRNKCLRFNS